jgi:two-component system nitrate/nitrite response regulator NarP
MSQSEQGELIGQRAAPIDIALADSNALMLGALSDVLERHPRFSLVFTARSAEGFLTSARRVPVHVGIIDWVLPTAGGAGLMRELGALAMPPRIVVYGSADPEITARQAMEAGAAGYCSRQEPVERLIETIEAVAQGRMVFPYMTPRQRSADPLASLTPKEHAMLAALARGLTNEQLAAEHNVSINTVKFHLRNLFDKLDVPNRAKAIALYYSGASRRE